jgi:hypothetical protein
MCEQKLARDGSDNRVASKERDFRDRNQISARPDWTIATLIAPSEVRDFMFGGAQ